MPSENISRNQGVVALMMIEETLHFAFQHGQSDEAWHLQWTIDQMVRILTGTDEAYAAWVKEYEDGGRWVWNTGIAP